MTDTIIPNCANCGTQLAEITTKNGRRIYACRNWRPDGKGCAGDIYDPNHEESRKKIYPRVLIRYNVASKSEKGKFRTVEVYETGDVRCNCIANNMNRECRHIKETIQYFGILFDKIREKYARMSDKR